MLTWHAACAYNTDKTSVAKTKATEQNIKH